MPLDYTDALSHEVGRLTRRWRRRRRRRQADRSALEQEDRLTARAVVEVEAELAEQQQRRAAWAEDLGQKQAMLRSKSDELREARRVLRERATLERGLRDAEVELRAALVCGPGPFSGAVSRVPAA